MKTGIELIAEERDRQIIVEGYMAEDDDEYTDRELARGAGAYLLHYNIGDAASWWPWGSSSFKPGAPIRDLIKAGALIAAEIDRLQRL